MAKTGLLNWPKKKIKCMLHPKDIPIELALGVRGNVTIMGGEATIPALS